MRGRRTPIGLAGPCLPEYRENTQLVLEAGTHGWQLVYIVVAALGREFASRPASPL
ncbi:MAG TPA: hypothetical protein VN712_05785 [Dermatophilaceae bacterium]|nr:hypothetical protein [Dermatophilaceae bacterium]